MGHGDFRWGTAFGMVVVVGVLGALILWAEAAMVELRWINPSPAQAATRILVETTGEEYAAPCGPGQTCRATVDLPTGVHDVRIRQGDPSEWSPYSNAVIYPVAALEGCAWDADGSGAVTAADFGAFLARFELGEVNQVDFGAFLRAFGRGSCL